MALFCLCLFIPFLLMGAKVNANEPCQNFEEIYDPYRSVKHRLKRGDTALCDNKLAKGWYRFKSGGQIPMTKPNPFYCGTMAPIWMKGSLPTTVGQRVKATACINLFNIRKGCARRLPMLVKYCKGDPENFYIYYLTPPRGCAMAFCAGEAIPCPKGKEGTPPNCRPSNKTAFPASKVPLPEITYRVDPAADVVELVCSFKFPAWTNVSYFVEWYSNSIKPVKRDRWCVPEETKNPSDDCVRRQSVAIFGKDFRAGHTVRCRLKMKYSTSLSNKWTKFGKDSNQFYVGIEVSPRHVIVKECNASTNLTVTLRPTVPILKFNDITNTDNVVVKIFVPEKFRKQRRQAAVDKCTVDLKTEDITHGKTITIIGICDGKEEEGTQTLSFYFKPESTNTHWTSYLYTMPALQVTVDNTETRLCLSTSDPNLFTFDYRRYFYNDPGDYLMYSNEAKKIQVHIRLWTCEEKVTCACAAAIREGKDVLVLSICNALRQNLKAEPTQLRIIKRSPGRLAKGIQITRKINGEYLEHEVILSSGTRVYVSRYYRTLNVGINAPATDKGHVKGLCGNFNDDKLDDFSQGGDGKPHEEQTSFAKSWLLEPTQSFFEVLPTNETEEKLLQGRSCYCRLESKGEIKEEETCDENANFFPILNDHDRRSIENVESEENKKRSVDGSDDWYSDDIIDQEYRSYFINDEQAQHAMNRIRSKRSLKTVMEEKAATKYCKQHIEESEAGRTCKVVHDKSVHNAVAQCVNDLKLTGDKSFAVMAFGTMKHVCEDAALKNVSLYSESPNGDLVPPREVVKDLCPSDCSGHGRCKNRTCICDEGFTALDCSMDVNAVPEILGIYNRGLCDIRERPCRKTSLFGRNFLNSKNLSCHVHEFKVYPGSWSPRGVPVTTHGEMTDLFGMKCDLPEPLTRLGDYDHEGTPAGGLLISVSNDGFNASVQKLRHVSYDSKCMNCSNSNKCELKPNSCLIRGHCFAANEPNPRDWCQQCLPETNHSSWMPRKNNQAPKLTTKTTMFAVKEEDLVIQLKATDPDNRPVTYSLVSSTATGYNLSRAGLLRWKVTSNEKFTFKVTDECGAFDTLNITMRIVRCQCLNGGQCVPHPYHPRGSGLYQCKCKEKFSGEHCEICKGIRNNKPPKFTSDGSIFALQGEDLTIQLKAEDPEEMNITYSILNSTATGLTLSPFGLLRLKVTSNSSFTIKLTDECDVFDTINMTLRIVQCSCLNGGQCVPHPHHPRGSGLYQCKCKEKFSGEHCEICKGIRNNKPPKFTSDRSIFALQGEDLTIQLKAEDPEEMNITYSLLNSTATSLTLSSSGLLKWKVTSNSSLTIKLTDECDVFSKIEMALRIVQCPCRNGGQCVPHPYHPPGSGLYQCKCKQNFSGEHCEIEMCHGIRKTDNKPPKLTSDRNIFALQGEYLSIQLKAEDPEEMNITYSLLNSTATGLTLSPFGLLRLKVTSNSSFTIKLTDECDVFDTINMTLRIVQCSCLNGGQCVPHPHHPRGSGLYQCKCKAKFSGEHCDICKGIRNNKPPKFTSDRSIFALQGEDLTIQLKAEDPEEMNITYSLLNSTATSLTLSSSGLLKWKVTSNSSLTIKLTDECDVFSTIEIALRIVQCPCRNGGQCVPHPYHPPGSGLYQCKCKQNFSGEHCEIEMCHGIRKTDNKPPKLTSDRDIFALQGEDLVIQLKAEDPEEMNITYSILNSTATGLTLSPFGLLRLKVTSNSSFTIKLTDECDVFDTINMTLRIVQCSCLNGGQCVPHPHHPRGSGLYQCKCKEKFSGKHCEICKGIRNNKPPKFTSDRSIFALQGEDLTIQLKAEDPEEMNITYSLINSTATSLTLSSSGLLKWKVTSNSSLTIKLTDECDVFDTINMKLRIVQCSCLNSGQCVPHPHHPRGSGLYQCKCKEKFSGEHCEICKGIRNNKPPKFTSDRSIFALQGEDLTIQLKAEDPEEMNITYSLLNSTATSLTLSSSGLLKWKVTSNSSFTIKLTDECDVFSTIEIALRIVQCPCRNGGQCVPHPYHPPGSGLYQCKCKQNFSGEHCEIEMCHGIRKTDNKPPKLTSDRDIFALQGEDLVIQLKAEDPEEMNITYSLLSSTATSLTLSSSGLLKWKVTSNSSFTIKLTDKCDVFDTIKMTLRIVQCPCFNGGKCVPHPYHLRGSGKYKCKCVKGFRGKWCQRCPGFVCPPRNITVKAIGSTKLEVNWLGPSDNLVTYYFVKYALAKYRFRQEQVPKTITTKTLTNLRKFADYRIAVSVVNRYGEKMVETKIKTGEDVPDAAPTITAVSPERYDTMLVRWSPIPKSKRNGRIVGYKIYYRKRYTDDAWNATTTTTGDLTRTMVAGLQSYTEYCVKMSGFTSKGEYPDWERKACYPVKTPSLPIKVSGKAISSREISLRFEKPQRSVASNKVQVSYGKNKGRLNRQKACYGSSCVIDNLEPDTMYYFRVIGYVVQRGETPSFTQIRTLSRG